MTHDNDCIALQVKNVGCLLFLFDCDLLLALGVLLFEEVFQLSLLEDPV